MNNLILFSIYLANETNQKAVGSFLAQHLVTNNFTLKRNMNQCYRITICIIYSMMTWSTKPKQSDFNIALICSQQYATSIHFTCIHKFKKGI